MKKITIVLLRVKKGMTPSLVSLALIFYLVKYLKVLTTLTEEIKKASGATFNI
jgi:hypothetical protein